MSDPLSGKQWMVIQGDVREVLAGMEKDERRSHVVPDPDSDGWLVLQMTDQEAFEWDCEHYGKSVALANWGTIHHDSPLKVEPGAEG